MPFLHFFHKFFEVILAVLLGHAFSIIHIYKYMAIFFIKKFVRIRAYARIFIYKGKDQVFPPGLYQFMFFKIILLVQA